jgi:hypothetical protein
MYVCIYTQHTHTHTHSILHNCYFILSEMRNVFVCRYTLFLLFICRHALSFYTHARSFDTLLGLLCSVCHCLWSNSTEYFTQFAPVHVFTHKHTLMRTFIHNTHTHTHTHTHTIHTHTHTCIALLFQLLSYTHTQTHHTPTNTHNTTRTCTHTPNYKICFVFLGGLNHVTVTGECT